MVSANQRKGPEPLWKLLKEFESGVTTDCALWRKWRDHFTELLLKLDWGWGQCGGGGEVALNKHKRAPGMGGRDATSGRVLFQSEFGLEGALRG